jgi:helicase
LACIHIYGDRGRNFCCDPAGSQESAPELRLGCERAIRTRRPRAAVTGAISYGLQTIAERGISSLSKILEGQGRVLSEAVRAYHDHLRFGEPTAGACILSKSGIIRHRRAAILLGATAEVGAAAGAVRAMPLETVGQLLHANGAGWRGRLGALTYENMMADVR